MYSCFINIQVNIYFEPTKRIRYFVGARVCTSDALWFVVCSLTWRVLHLLAIISATFGNMSTLVSTNNSQTTRFTAQD